MTTRPPLTKEQRERKKELARKRYAERADIRERDNAASRAYYQAHKPVQREKAKANYYANHPRELWRAAKARAEKKGLEFNIDPEDIVIPEMCPVFGTPIVTPSIDRVDNNFGYIKGNVQVIDRESNRIKGSATIPQLEALIKYIKDHENGKAKTGL